MIRSLLLKQLSDFALVHERKAHGCMIDGLPKACAEYTRKAKVLREAVKQLSTQNAEVRPALLKQLSTFAGRMEWYVVYTTKESDRNFWTDMAVLLREAIKQLTERSHHETPQDHTTRITRAQALLSPRGGDAR